MGAAHANTTPHPDPNPLCPAPSPKPPLARPQVLDGPGTADLSAWVDFGALRVATDGAGSAAAATGPVAQVRCSRRPAYPLAAQLAACMRPIMQRTAGHITRWQC